MLQEPAKAMLEAWDPSVTWIVVVGFILAFFLAFGVGANDVANSFGTSVGSKVLTLRQACILATIFEILGAILIGYKVSETVRKGIFDTDLYIGSERELMLGNLAALGGSAVWNLVATFFRLPVSGTHSIVGAVLGFALITRGPKGIQWVSLGKIVASWFISPILSGLVSVAILLIIRKCILSKKNQLEAGLFSLPFFYGFTIFVNAFSIIHDGPQMLKFDQIPWWGALIAALGISGIVCLVVIFFLVPYQRRQIHEILRLQAENKVPEGEIDAEQPDQQITVLNSDSELKEIQELNKTPVNLTKVTKYPTSNGNVVSESPGEVIDEALEAQSVKFDPAPLANGVNVSPTLDVNSGDDPPETAKLFSFLQVLTAVFGSFAHGGNDVSNAIGPLIALWMVFKDGSGQQSEQPDLWLLLYGGVGISIGLWIWGRKVIKTLGEDLTKITPSNGFTIEIGAASTVLLASKIGLPISTTHCKVGSVVFVGWVRSRQGVDWSLFRNIVMAWLLTLPITGALSAALMAILFAAAGS